jgi:hypothetical protein
MSIINRAPAHGGDGQPGESVSAQDGQRDPHHWGARVLLIMTTAARETGLNRWIGLGLVAIAALMVWSTPQAVWAAEADFPLLTLEILQQQLDTPVQRDGKPTIDLRGQRIDLRPENGDFGDRFYRLLQTHLQSGSTPLGLDLSNAVIQGPFDLQRLSLREPLYGDALFPLLTEQEQAQLQRDRARLSQLSQLSRSLLLQPQPQSASLFLLRGPLFLSQTEFAGPVNGAHVFFLGPVTAQGAIFRQGATFAESRFSQPATFMASQFQGDARWRGVLFFDRVRFDQSRWEQADFQGSEFFALAGFTQATFAQSARFNRVHFRGTADLAQTQWQGAATFLQAQFDQDLFFTNARFEAAVSLHQARFVQPVNLRGAAVQRQLDLGDSVFGTGAYVNVANLEFDADQAELLGSPGQVGRVLSVPSLTGNETLLRNLVRNFRQREQVADANQLEYLTERLRLQQWQRQLTATNLNTVSPKRLQQLGLTATQAAAIVAQRQIQPLVQVSDILNLDGINLATYVKVRDRIVVQAPLTGGQRLQLGAKWLGLAALLLMSHYGTNVGLVLGVGTVAVAIASGLFWGVDRFRRLAPSVSHPPVAEQVWMITTAVLVTGVGGLTIGRCGDTAGWTMIAIALLTLPVPLGLILAIYRQGRFHDQLDSSYLVEDGSARQLRLLIARLPIIPSFPFYRDRYRPIRWDRRYTWLFYYDFSFNNWFKFGFNDVRLRDTAVPGLITALVWYQWTLGLTYVVLLLWTLSRTIPGLNLLLYF